MDRYGLVSMVLMLIAGVSGPLIDSFLGGKLDRREIVASKAICRIVNHGMKLVYFGSIVVEAASLDPVLAVLPSARRCSAPRWPNVSSRS